MPNPTRDVEKIDKVDGIAKVICYLLELLFMDEFIVIIVLIMVGSN